MKTIYIAQYVNTMAKRIKLNEAQLKKLVREAVLGELDNDTYETAGKAMASKYRQMFIRRVQNAAHGGFGDVERVVKEFYEQFKDKVINKNFNLKNLMGLAERIEDSERSGSHYVPGAGSADNGFWEYDAFGGDSGAFGRSFSEKMREGKKSVKLNEAQLKKIIAESVKKVLKEVRSRRGSAIGTTFVPTSVYEGVVDSLLKSGKLNEDEAENLFNTLENVFANVKIKGRFSWYKSPGSYYNPPENSCELVEIINDDEVIDKLNALQIPDEINALVVSAFEEWCESQMDEGYDETWEGDRDDDGPDPEDCRYDGMDN